MDIYIIELSENFKKADRREICRFSSDRSF